MLISSGISDPNLKIAWTRKLHYLRVTQAVFGMQSFVKHEFTSQYFIHCKRYFDCTHRDAQVSFVVYCVQRKIIAEYCYAEILISKKKYIKVFLHNHIPTLGIQLIHKRLYYYAVQKCFTTRPFSTKSLPIDINIDNNFILSTGRITSPQVPSSDICTSRLATRRPANIYLHMQISFGRKSFTAIRVESALKVGVKLCGTYIFAY